MKPTEFFKDVFELSPSPNSFAWYQKCCEAFRKCVLGENHWHPIENILRHFEVLSQPKFSWNLLKFFKDVFELCPGPNSFAWYQKCCKAFPKCVLGKIQWHPIQIILWHFQIVSQPKLGWILLKLFQDVFELSPSPNSFAWYQNCCEAFPKCVLGENQWHPIENILRHFEVLSQPNFSWNLLNFSKTFSICLLAQIHLHGTKNVVRHFENVS